MKEMLIVIAAAIIIYIEHLLQARFSYSLSQVLYEEGAIRVPVLKWGN